MHSNNGYVPLALVSRGETTESVHYGCVAVVALDGTLLAHAGNPDHLIFTRSSVKPFQAMPMVARGGVEKYGLEPAELAVICASHSGEVVHEEAVRSILAKIGCSEADLQCGSHVPIALRTTDVPFTDKSAFSPVLNNCSGKHSGMLAFCGLLGVSHDDYLDFHHPIQREIKRSISHFTGVADDRMRMGIDGCSAPNFALPLSGLALAFARLADPTPDEAYGEAPAKIFSAMTAHPLMVSGTGRGDLATMTTGKGDWVSKAGGEAVQGIGVRSRGLGIAIKIADGNPRAMGSIVVEVLKQLDLLKAAEGTPLAEFERPPVSNHRDILTGHIAPEFVLERVRQPVTRRGH